MTRSRSQLCERAREKLSFGLLSLLSVWLGTRVHMRLVPALGGW